MKRKGLIVSSIVMVIVLIASLTTATYAWFSASSSAALEDMFIQTVASQGLQMGVYNEDTPTSASSFYSGNVKLDANTKPEDPRFRAESLGFGQRLTVLPNASGIYSASGNGVMNTMFAGYPSAGQRSSGVYDLKPKIGTDGVTKGKPTFIGKASEYSCFVMDFLVQYTDDAAGAPDLVIQDVSIVAKDASGKSGKQIAASTRIALFSSGTLPDYTAESATAYPTHNDMNAWTIANNGVFVIEPYPNIEFSGGQYVAVESPAATNHIKSVQNYSGSDDSVAYTGENVTPSSGTLKDDWVGTEVTSGFNGLSKYISLEDTTAATKAAKWEALSTKTSVSANAGSYLKTETTTVVGNKGLKVDSNGIHVCNFTAGNRQVVLRLVIWFEGQDNMCRNELANGGGISVNMKFSTADQFKGTLESRQAS